MKELDSIRCLSGVHAPRGAARDPDSAGVAGRALGRRTRALHPVLVVTEPQSRGKARWHCSCYANVPMDHRRCDLETDALYEIGKVLSLGDDITKALNSTLHLLRLFLGMENGTVSLFDPVTGEVFIEAAPEMNDAERILGRLRPGEGIVGRIFQTGLPMAIPDIGAEPLFLNRTGSWRNLAEDPRALLGVPIREGRVTVGVLTVDRPHRGGPFSFDRDIRFLTLVAMLIGIRVRLSRLESPGHSERDVAPDAAPPERFGGVVAASAKMRDLLALLARVAPSRATVFLRGESGTGKEVLARALHEASPRAARPFVAVNCAALPEALLESELFGHEKGAFTGAAQAQPGRFELADGGTLFLDEVGELPPAAQVKLLRAVQERQFERVGGRRTITVDVRLVAATNRDLEEAVRNGAFRLDLYHRLSVVTVVVPPLRERPEDIPVLAEHFLRELNEENGTQVELAPDALDALLDCRWSGNARQLRNCIERSVVSSERSRVTAADLACFDPDLGAGCLVERIGVPEPGAAPAASRAEPQPADDEPARVRAALERSGWVQAKAARLLGLTVRQLAYRVRKYGIELQRL